MKVYFTKESANGYPAYLTPEKRYKVKKNKASLIIINDFNRPNHICIEKSAHLDNGHWIVDK